jgi:hypothetical protein
VPIEKEVKPVAMCDYCGKTDRKMVEIPNGRTNLKLCPFCKAEYDLRQGGAIVLPASGLPKPSLWQRFKKLLG